MSDRKDCTIVAFVGMPGSGKSTAVSHVTAKGHPKVYFGGIVLDALADAGLDRTAENERYMRQKLRREEGEDFIAQRIIRQISNLVDAGQRQIVVDGLYSWTEYKAMKRAFPGSLEVIALLAPRKVRHHRLANRPERPFTAEEAKNRDWNEIEELEKGGPIAMADYFIVNDDNDLAKYEAAIDSILNDIKF